MNLATISSQRGLSPRVRGNPSGLATWLFEKRSIPACAGEPLPLRAPGTAMTVYPRVCGGTGYLG